ncbi:MAG: DUF2207 domain-containing protein [Propionibacterium sp.]|nr:DUF2207 domain-containing protein [Propionibacterium sp.]
MLRTTLRALVVALALVLLPFATPAHAATDVVRGLDVHFDVSADGTVHARYEIDWDFGQTGRRGIEFDLVTAEVWELDPSLHAVYDITDVEVSSPTGAPATFTQTDRTDGDGRRHTSLRIGDPDRALDTSRETYVISYAMAGGLRTFDGVPELHLDVTSDDYPAIERFSVTIDAAAGDVPRARCLAGPRECGADVAGGAAMLTGTDVASGETITAVAELPAAQRGAEPRLQERQLRAPLELASETLVEIRRDGSADFTQRTTYALPDGAQRVRHSLPVRRGATWVRDRLFDVTDFDAATADGTPLTHRTSTTGRSRSDVTLAHDVEFPADHGGQIEMVSTWSVAGTVEADGDTARFAWPLGTSIVASTPTSGSITRRAPGAIDDVGCEWRGPQDVACLDGAMIDGASATLTWEQEVLPDRRNQWMVVELPAASVADVAATTGLSRDSILVTAAIAVVVGAIASFLFMARIGAAVGRVRIGTKDQHYADAPPGETGRDVSDAPFQGQVPVRFQPPAADVARAGFVLDRRFDGRHTAATLVQMAVAGSVRLGTEPFAVAKLDGDRATSKVEWALFRRATTNLTDRLTKNRMQLMNAEVEKEFRQVALVAHFRRGNKQKTTATRVFHVAAGRALPALALGMFLAGVPPMFPALVAIAALLFLRGLITGAAEPTYALNADGTALRQQVLGFRTYIRTAEADQLAYEADRDVYRRYLPWAVLFGETKRWTKVCEQLAEAGRIPRLDTSFMPGVASAAVVGRRIRRMDSRLHNTLTTRQSATRGPGISGGSGGFRSGGRSGFGGGSRGGSGGGGSSGRSW